MLEYELFESGDQCLLYDLRRGRIYNQVGVLGTARLRRVSQIVARCALAGKCNPVGNAMAVWARNRGQVLLDEVFDGLDRLLGLTDGRAHGQAQLGKENRLVVRGEEDIGNVAEAVDGQRKNRECRQQGKHRFFQNRHQELHIDAVESGIVALTGGGGFDLQELRT